MLVPQFGPQYLTNDYDILKQKEAFYNNALTPTLAYWGQASTDTQYYSGDQNLWASIYGNLPAYVRKNYNFNLIMPFCNMISGHQRRTRKSTIVVPVENANQETADEYTKVMMHINRKENVEETISEAFYTGSIITGLNLLQLWIDYGKDPISGDIKVSNCSYNTIIMDPYWTKLDLSDCNGIVKRDFLMKNTLVAMYPELADFIASIPSNQNGNNKDNKFQYTPQSYDYGMTNLLIYDQYYYRDYRTAKILIDTNTGETREVQNAEKELVQELMRREPALKIIEQQVPTVKAAFFIQDKVVYSGQNPLGIDHYPFIPVVGYRRPEIPYYEWRIQGVVRNMRDPQFLYNRFIVNMADVCESQVNSGYKYKENALVNPKDVFMTGQGKGIAIKEEAAMSDVEKIVPTEASQSMFKLADIFDNLMHKTSGVTEELMGMASDSDVGITQALRQGASLTTLQVLFDHLDESQKILGERMLELIQKNYMPGKIQRILGKEPSPQFYNKAFGKYGCVIEDGINTSTQRQMQTIQLLELKKLGIPVPDSVILDSITVQNKTQLIQAISQQQQQASQQQQAASQIQMQEVQARTQLAQARAQADMGLAQERTSRVAENQALAVERVAQAKKDDEIALLNFIRALKELDSMDLDHLQKLFTIHQSVKNQETQQNQGLPLS